MDKLQERSELALELMAEFGYPIEEEVLFEVDEKLPFMGYTTERDGKTLIVVAGWSLATDMSMGLIIHELSHVYRIQSFHPSHNSSLHSQVLHDFFHDTPIPQYQHEILHTIINHLQDLYADDISFEVYITKTNENINEFFLGWIHTPLTGAETLEDKWKNAQLLLSAAFAQANLERHHVVDTGHKLEQAIANFLSKLDKKYVIKYEFFKTMMVHFPEKVTDEEFKKYLTKYIAEFLKLTEN